MLLSWMFKLIMTHYKNERESKKKCAYVLKVTVTDTSPISRSGYRNGSGDLSYCIVTVDYEKIWIHTTSYITKYSASFPIF